MSFNTDSHYEIGCSHKVCEDFAIHGSFEAPNGSILHYGIVSDGCSSSMNEGGVRNPINVDIGARLLCLVAKQVIRESLPTLKVLDVGLYTSLRCSIMSKIDIQLRQLNLPIPVVDCTLLVNVVYENKGFTAIFGDGVFVRECDSYIEIFIIGYESGAPYYMAYHLDGERDLRYKKKFGDGKKTIKRIIFNKNEGTFEEQNSSMEYNSCLFYITDIDVFPNLRSSIISDGVLTYQMKNSKGCEKLDIPPRVIIPKLTNVNGVNGNFLGRIMNLVHRWERNEEVAHYDDMSISSIIQLPQKDEIDG